MKKRLSIGTIVPLLSMLVFQNVMAQVTGEVTSLHPKDGDQLCIHQYEKAVANAFIKNDFERHAIRGRICLQIDRRIAGNHWEIVDAATEVKLLDVMSNVNFSVACKKDLPHGFYQANVWLQWQHVSNNPETGPWMNLVFPTQTTINTGDNTVNDPNSLHLFTIRPCDFNLPSGPNSKK